MPRPSVLDTKSYVRLLGEIQKGNNVRSDIADIIHFGSSSVYYLFNNLVAYKLVIPEKARKRTVKYSINYFHFYKLFVLRSLKAKKRKKDIESLWTLIEKDEKKVIDFIERQFKTNAMLWKAKSINQMVEYLVELMEYQAIDFALKRIPKRNENASILKVLLYNKKNVLDNWLDSTAAKPRGNPV